MLPGQADHQNKDFNKAALCGQPSYVWRAGQKRRLQMILDAAGERLKGAILENGCGVGQYIDHLGAYPEKLFGLEIEFERAMQAALAGAKYANTQIICAAGEMLPFSDDSFDLILSHEVLEHVSDDYQSVIEMVRALKPGGRIVLFVPNRGYPFETHGIFWNGRYHFGNIPLVNYLPRAIRNRFAPHVRVYSKKDLSSLFKNQPVQIIDKTIIFGAYDNIIARNPWFGKSLRSILQFLERTPFKCFGLSHFWVIEKTS